MRLTLIISYVFAIIAILACAVSEFMQGCDGSLVSFLGSGSTIVSILLSIVAMIYSNISEKKSAKTLEDIVEQNRQHVEMIKMALSKDNYNDVNINSLTQGHLGGDD